MRTLYALETNGNIYFSESSITTFPLASIQNIPVLNDSLVISEEGLHVADEGQWIAIHTVESLTSAPKLKAISGSVDKPTVISRIQDYLRQQSDELVEVTLSNTSTHNEVLGGRVAKQVVSTIEAGKYLNIHLADMGWEVSKAGKDFITLKRIAEDKQIEPGEVEIQKAIEYHETETVSRSSEEGKKNFWDLMKSR
jgi:hypothetical protein